MALPGETGGSRPKSSPPTITKLPQVTKTPSTYNSYSPPIKYSTGTSTTSPSNLTSGTTTTYRDGDYIIYVRNGVIIKREYSPLYSNKAKTTTTTKTGSGVSTGAQVARTASSGDTGRSTTSGGSGVPSPTVTRTSGGSSVPTGSSVSSGGGGSFGSPNQAQDTGYGWTAGMSDVVRDMGLDQPQRIMNQVLGRELSPGASAALMPYMLQGLNPWLQLMMTQGLGTDTGITSGRHDEYNFGANYFQNATSPGGAAPNFNEALRILAQGMANPSSAIWGALNTLPENIGGGIPTAAALMNNFMEAINALTPGLSNASLMGLGGLMPAWQDAYLNSAMAVPGTAGYVDPIQYLMRNVFGINANMSQPSATDFSSVNFNPFS